MRPRRHAARAEPIQPSTPPARQAHGAGAPGTPVAQDGEQVWHTPYDDCVLVMPGARNLKAGVTAVRLGRFEN